MTKDVFVTIKGLQVSSQMEPDPIEIVALGEYYEQKGKKYIKFDEVVDGMEGQIRNMIKISPTCMEVTKKGLTNAHMVFEENKKNRSFYYTPFGDFSIGIMGKSIETNETENELKVKVTYELDMNYEHMADCTINIDVKSKGQGEISLS